MIHPDITKISKKKVSSLVYLFYILIVVWLVVIFILGLVCDVYVDEIIIFVVIMIFMVAAAFFNALLHIIVFYEKFDK